jgi:RNA polymerase sigma-70 factor (ECF subfamily)
LTMPSDKTLIEAVFAGEKAAFAQLYDRYAPLVRAISYDATGNLPDAQDLSQDVFLRAYQRLHTLREPELFGRWIIAITRLRCKEWLRRQVQNQDKLNRLNNEKTFSSESSNDGQIEHLRQMLRQLPEKERLVMHTFYLQDKSADEACRIFGLSRSGLYRVLERARKQLVILMAEKRQDDL